MMDSVVKEEAAEHSASEEQREFHKFILKQINSEALIPGSRRVLPINMPAQLTDKNISRDVG